jgi:hypothetical protein
VRRVLPVMGLAGSRQLAGVSSVDYESGVILEVCQAVGGRLGSGL